MEQARCKSLGGRSPLRESFPSQGISSLALTMYSTRISISTSSSSLQIIRPPPLEVTRNDSHEERTSRRSSRPLSSGGGIWISKSSGTSVSVTACLLRALSLGDSPCTEVSISSGFPILGPPLCNHLPVVASWYSSESSGSIFIVPLASSLIGACPRRESGSCTSWTRP